MVLNRCPGVKKTLRCHILEFLNVLYFIDSHFLSRVLRVCVRYDYNCIIPQVDSPQVYNSIPGACGCHKIILCMQVPKFKQSNMSCVKIFAARSIVSIVLLMFVGVANAFAAAPKTSVDAKETKLHSGSNGIVEAITEQSPLAVKSDAESDFGNDFNLGPNLQLDTTKQRSSPLPPSLPSPIVHRNAAYTVNRTSNIIYASSVVCRVGCAGHTPGKSSIPGFNASANCVCPSYFNLTLDVYAPVGAEGLRPGFVAIHSGEGMCVEVRVCEAVSMMIKCGADG